MCFYCWVSCCCCCCMCFWCRLDLECFFIELVEEVPCENIEQLLKIEGKYIRSIGTLNIHIAGRTSSEYAQDHKGRLTENRKLRYTENKDTELEQGIIYKEQNKDSISAQRKTHYQQNKHTLAERQLTVCSCECGLTYTLKHKARHTRSSLHQKHMHQQQQQETQQ